MTTLSALINAIANSPKAVLVITTPEDSHELLDESNTATSGDAHHADALALLNMLDRINSQPGAGNAPGGPVRRSRPAGHLAQAPVLQRGRNRTPRHLQRLCHRCGPQWTGQRKPGLPRTLQRLPIPPFAAKHHHRPVVRQPQLPKSAWHPAATGQHPLGNARTATERRHSCIPTSLPFVQPESATR